MVLLFQCYYQIAGFLSSNWKQGKRLFCRPGQSFAIFVIDSSVTGTVKFTLSLVIGNSAP